MIFAFGEHRLDLDRRELRRGNDRVELEPQVFDLLAYLVRHRHRVVSKADLLQAVWNGRAVSDSALNTRINAARRALDDDGTAQRLIRTYTRKGFRFVGDVSEMPERLAAASFEAEAASLASQAPPTVFDRPSLAVLPFINLSDDRELDLLAAGTIEEITTALSRITWLSIFTRDPKIPREGVPVSRTPIAREPGVRYVVGGSVRKGNDRVRIVVRLTATETGGHLWADHFDGSLDDVFGLQEKAAWRVAGAIEPLLQALESARADGLAACDLTAHDAYMRAFAMVIASAQQIRTALVLLEKAISRQPDYGPALALAANCHMRLCMDGTSRNPEADTRKAAEYALNALQVAADDPGVLANVARPLAYAGEDIGTTIALMDRALELNPSFARGWYIRGFLKYWAGDTETSIEEVETAQSLSPCGRFGTALTAIGNALVFSRRFEEALPMLQLAIREDPAFPPNYRLLAVCYAHLGRLDDARAAVARLPGAAPLSIPDLARSYRAMFRNPEHRELALTGLRLATGQ